MSEQGAPAQRILALSPHIVEMLFAIGAGDKIVGTTAHADYPEAAKKIPLVGNYARLNIEAIIALKPDLIIAWKSGNPSDDLQRIEAMGFNVVYSQPTELEDVGDELIAWGQLTGREAQSLQVANEYEAQLTVLREQYKQAAPIAIFYELWSNPLTTVANDSWLQKQVALCGAKNIFDDLKGDYPQVNLEQVIVRAPEVIIQPRSEGEHGANGIPWSRYVGVPAVAKKQFIYPNPDKTHRMTPRVLEEIESMCQRLDQFRHGAH